MNENNFFKIIKTVLCLVLNISEYGRKFIPFSLLIWILLLLRKPVIHRWHAIFLRPCFSWKNKQYPFYQKIPFWVSKTFLKIPKISNIHRRLKMESSNFPLGSTFLQKNIFLNIFFFLKIYSFLSLRVKWISLCKMRLEPLQASNETFALRLEKLHLH